jgi:hypothetical protein
MGMTMLNCDTQDEREERVYVADVLRAQRARLRELGGHCPTLVARHHEFLDKADRLQSFRREDEQQGVWR